MPKDDEIYDFEFPYSRLHVLLSDDTSEVPLYFSSVRMT